MKLVLTREQSEQLTGSIQPSVALLGRVMREPFDGSNAQTCGRLILELGTVATNNLPALRDAIRKAKQPATKRIRKATPASPGGWRQV